MKIERGTLRRGETKTPRSRRPLRLRIVSGSRYGRPGSARGRIAFGPERRGTESGRVFTTEVGTPIHPADLRRSFRALTERAGLGHWTPNELRHTAATLLYEARVPLDAIADVLGHESTRMLEQHHRHRTRRVLDAHVEAMDRRFATP